MNLKKIMVIGSANTDIVVKTAKLPLPGETVLGGNHKKSTNENSLPSLCYNAMINPLIPFAFQGVLWYQSESNAPRAYQYRTAFPLLINYWRQKWNKPNFPFYYMELATYRTSGNSNESCYWDELQEAQTLTLKVTNTGMAVTPTMEILTIFTQQTSWMWENDWQLWH